MPTPTLYKFISSELHRVTPDEMVDDDDNLVFFDSDFQIMPKILDFDNDVQDITDNLFNGLSLDDPVHDEHFKKTFLFRFMNRQINRQTIEAFKFELMNTFLTSKSYINRVYQDSEKYILQYSENEGTSQELSNEISQMVNEQITEQLDRRENEEQNSSQSKQNTSNYSTQHTINDSDSGIVTPMKNMIDKEITIAHVFIQPYDSFDEKTGKLTSGVVTTLEDVDGEYYVTSSKTVYYTLQNIFSTFGNPQDDNYKPVKVKVLGRKQQNGIQIDLELIGLA